MIIWFICAFLTSIYVAYNQENPLEDCIFTILMSLMIWPFILVYEINQKYFKELQ